MVAGLAFLHSCSSVQSNPPSLHSSPLLEANESGKTRLRFQHLESLCCTATVIHWTEKTYLYTNTDDRQPTSNSTMNTTSILLTGRPVAALTMTSNKSCSPRKPTLLSPSCPTSAKSATPTPPNTPTSSPILRPRHLRRVSSDSTGWYLDDDTPSLQEFEARAQTLIKRLEKFANRCATNAVMGLMSPAAVVLIVFNPIMLVLTALLIFAMLGGWS